MRTLALAPSGQLQTPAAMGTSPWQQEALWTLAWSGLLFAAVRLLLELGSDLHAGGQHWRQGDWLISLAGGPLRRGPFGSLALWTAGQLGVGPIELIVWLQAGLVVLLCWLTYRIVRGLPDPSLGLLLFGGPALFPAFWTNDLPGALRKELLPLAALALLAATPMARSAASRGGVGVLVALLYVLGCAGHEVVALFLPAMGLGLWALARARCLPRNLCWGLGSLCALAALGTGLYAVAYPTTDDVAAQCAALTSQGVGVQMCDGALSWTDGDPVRFAHFAAYFMQPPKTWSHAALTAFSVSLLAYAHRSFGAQRRLFALLLLQTLPFVPLLWVAIDWGRFTCMALCTHAFSVALLASTGAIHMTRRPSAWVALAGVAVALYVTPQHTIGWLERFGR